jgi:hypothetical protein
MPAFQIAERELKTYPFMELKTAADKPGAFSGYASAYTKDLQGDKIAPGAFAQSIASRKGMVPILLNHDPDQMLGVSTSLAEDGKGLMLNGQLFMDTTAGKDMYGLLQAASSMDYRMGMSIGFDANDWDMENDGRMIKEIDLWEVSITPFPAQPKAYVADVKSVREFERYLRDVERLSKSDARRIASVLSDFNLSTGGMLEDANRYSRVLRAVACSAWKEDE